MPIFYKMISPDNQEHFLLGTEHCLDLSKNMPSEIMQALTSSEIAMFEVNMPLDLENDVYKAFEDMKTEVLTKWIFQEEPGLQNGFSKSQLTRMLKNIKIELYEIPKTDEALLQYCIERVDVLRITPPLHCLPLLLGQNTPKAPEAPEAAMDFFLHAKAVSAQKTIHYIESHMEQLEVLMCCHLGYSDQINIVNFIDNAYLNHVQLIDYPLVQHQQYLAQEMKDFPRFYVEIPTKCTEQPISFTRYFQAEEARDLKMASRISENLSEGKQAFIAIGAAHLAGVISYFKKQGYKFMGIHLGEPFISTKENRQQSTSALTFFNQTNNKEEQLQSQDAFNDSTPNVESLESSCSNLTL